MNSADSKWNLTTVELVCFELLETRRIVNGVNAGAENPPTHDMGRVGEELNHTCGQHSITLVQLVKHELQYRGM